MRVYSDCYELMSEVFRDVWEMGHLIHPHSYQNKIVKGNEDFSTREITNYSYCLTSLVKKEYLFFSDTRSIEWSLQEFEERISKDYRNPGKAWEMRKDVWEQFLNDNGVFDYSYNERITISLDTVIDELKVNPDTRQAIVSIWEPETDIQGIGGRRRVPCSMYYQFLIRDGQLNIIYNQRSADVMTHFGNDVFLAFRLMKYVSERVKVKPGYLFHNIGSLHAYKKDWPKLKTNIEDLNKLG